MFYPVENNNEIVFLLKFRRLESEGMSEDGSLGGKQPPVSQRQKNISKSEI